LLDIIVWLAGIDRAVFIFINSTLANPVTDFIMPILTRDLHLKIVYGAIMLFLLIKGPNRLRWAVLFSAVVVTLTDQTASSLIKPALERLRPCKVMEVHLLVGCGAGFSMPSSHAANLFGQAYFFFGVSRPSARYLIPFAIVVALSRVFVGVHYPADIIVGAALGTILGYLVSKVFHYIAVRTGLKEIGEAKSDGAQD
jgi:undecaprenyl-diphosphatase